MLITLQNNAICLVVDTLGAQITNLRSNQTEYLWQGDPRYWADRAPTLFPFIGRLWSNRYQFLGDTYAMGIHGFAAGSEFSLAEQGADYAVLTLSDTPSTLESYPFAFTLTITYRLVEKAVGITYAVRNKDTKIIPFGIGGHPGFRVPLEQGEQFEDYYLEFTTACQPDRVGFTPAVYLNGRDQAYPLEDGRRLPLRHDLFDEDAVILKNMGREVTLRSKKSGHFVKISYPQMRYLGIWHLPKSDAPYVCIEPWTSLPGRQDVVEEFSCKSDLIHLLPGKTYENIWTISVGEDLHD